jgi:diketogulonate reductase-like aldo/keto reductase
MCFTCHQSHISSAAQSIIINYYWEIKLFQAKPEEIENAVSTALECGYRHIDTATNYNNEDAIGKALKKWFEKGGTREEIFITTKVMYHNE